MNTQSNGISRIGIFEISKRRNSDSSKIHSFVASELGGVGASRFRNLESCSKPEMSEFRQFKSSKFRNFEPLHLRNLGAWGLLKLC